jgi:hypothetical protein
MRTVHGPAPWLIRAYGAWCFCPDSATDTSHGPSGGEARVSTTARMSFRAVRCKCDVPNGAFGWLGGTSTSGRASTVHIRTVSGGLPEHTHTQA